MLSGRLTPGISGILTDTVPYYGQVVLGRVKKLSAIASQIEKHKESPHMSGRGAGREDRGELASAASTLAFRALHLDAKHRLP